MRAIGFRAWDTENKTWTFVTLGDLICGACTTSGDKPLSGAPQVWEQYTGLKDKNGKEIYEGDIVNKRYFNLNVYDGRGVVHMGELKDSDGWANGDILGWKAGGSSLLDVHSECEVIGNIHQNPKLIKKEDNDEV